VNDDRFKIFSGTANPVLAESICHHLNVPLGKALLGRFSDGEIYFQILENVRGADVFVVQPCHHPVDCHLMELLLMIDAFKRASAWRITAVLPYYCYARQDRKDKPRVPISAKLVADLLDRRSEPGADTGLACAADSGLFRCAGRSPVRLAGFGRIFSSHESAEFDGRFAGCGRRGASEVFREEAGCAAGNRR
jgi:hypothetical protein